MMNRAGFAIHGRGQHGSDGCIVPTKVTAQNGPILVGDLLVSSSMPGYAMKGSNHKHMTGATVGKALDPLRSGTGIIRVLVTLQ